MSWYSDGEDGYFDEWEGCEHCNFNDGSSIETCISCGDRNFDIPGVSCETCFYFHWEPVNEVFLCGNNKSDNCNEVIYSDDCCDCWTGV